MIFFIYLYNKHINSFIKMNQKDFNNYKLYKIKDKNSKMNK